jgi:acetamidase/formamidase
MSIRRFMTLAVLTTALCSGQLPAEPRTHLLKAMAKTVHKGYFDSALPPVLKIKSGDTVIIETAGEWTSVKALGASDAEIPDSFREIAKLPRGPGPHVMVGPIEIEGAEPGDSLEVRLNKFDFLVNYGVAGSCNAVVTNPDGNPAGRWRLVRFDPSKPTFELLPGVNLELAPYFANIAVAPPPSMGQVSTRPPGIYVGNMDNKDLQAGSTLFMPIHIKGAMLSFGDSHGVQGHGEVGCVALETWLRGTAQVILHKGKSLDLPRGETPTHYMSMGFNEDLDKAASTATEEMVKFLVARYGLTWDEAVTLCSLGMDLHVTQLVDGVKGIHGMLPKRFLAGRKAIE